MNTKLQTVLEHASAEPPRPEPVLCLECGTAGKHATVDCPFRPAAQAAGQPVENSSN